MIEEWLIDELEDIFKKYNKVDRVVLFGSRARGDNNKRSDIDLCLFGKINHSDYSQIYMELDEINTFLKFDLLNFGKLEKRELIDNILEDGVEIYNGKKIR